MNETERIERAAIAAYYADIADLVAESDIWLPWEDVGSIVHKRYRDMARAAVAAADAPVLGLDELLDSVHPWARIYDVELLEDGDWVADIHWPRDMHNDHGNWYEAQGLGPTRTEAIRAAVAQATTQEGEQGDE